jgi:biopolymer transport protein TolR
MAMSSEKGKRLMSDINVTPLVDVMLVLLVIFMVTAPMMMQGVEVNLPTTKTAPIKSQEDPLILTVDKKGDIYLENHLIKIEEKKKSFSGRTKNFHTVWSSKSWPR